MKFRNSLALAIALIAWWGLIALVWWANYAHAQTGAFAGGQKFVVISLASTNAQLIGIPGPHQLLELTPINTSAAVNAIKLYDTAVSPTCANAPIAYYEVAGATAPLTATVPINLGPLGATFQSGIGVCIITPAAPPTLTDTAVASAGLVVNFTIK